jgi:hypothetical protein
VATLGDIVNAQVVSSALVSAGVASERDAGLLLERAWPYRRLPLVALYREDGGAPGGWWTVAALPGGPLPGTLKRGLKNGRVVAVPSLNAVVQRFPDDLPTLARGRLAPWLGADFDAGNVEAEPIGYKPMRRFVARYRFVSGDGTEQTLFGKCFRPGADEESWSAHSALARTMHRQHSWEPDVAPPEGRIPEWKMLVWRRAPGTAFLQLLEDADAASVAERIGGALAALHRSKVTWQRRHTTADELSTVWRWIELAKRAFPHSVPRLDRACEELIRLTHDPSPSRLRPSHRDFYDKQVLVHGEKMTFLDLDTACLAEPELDLGNFLAHLRLRRLQRPQLRTDDVGNALIEGYVARTGPPDRRRLHFYEACAITRLACVYAFRPRWRGLASELLEESLASISDTSRQGRPVHAI